MFHVMRELENTGKLKACQRAIREDKQLSSWRGHRWKSSPRFAGPYEPRLSIDRILGYEGEVGDTARVRFERFRGRAYHELYHEIVRRPKAAILSATSWSRAYRIGLNQRRAGRKVIDTILKKLHASRKIDRGELSERKVNELKECLQSCWAYEMRLLEAELQFRMNRDPAIDPGRFVDFIPLQSEYGIDGSRLSLSDRLSVDGFFMRVPTMIEIKTTRGDQTRQRLWPTGYALAYESHTRINVDFGCVMHIDMRSDRSAPILDCDIFPITTKYRDLFWEWRSSRMLEEQARMQEAGT